MRAGIEYVGAVRTAAHADWSTNFLDRDACEVLVQATFPLFEQVLSEMVKNQFSDILDALEQRLQAEDVDMDADEEEEAEGGEVLSSVASTHATTSLLRRTPSSLFDARDQV